MKQQLIDLLKNEIGFEVNVFDMLSIHQLEDGRWRICVESKIAPDYFDEYLFDKLEEAVDSFLKRRDEMKLGYDYETVKEIK